MKGRNLLMIPGPIEFEPSVLSALAEPTTSHVAADFIEVFGEALERTRRVFLSQDGQPFVIAGSGTLAMDLAGANLVEPGDRVLVTNTGCFGDRFGALLERYGAQVTHLRALSVQALVGGDRAELSQQDTLVTVTHVAPPACSPMSQCGPAGPSARDAVRGGRGLLRGRRGTGMSAWGVGLALTACKAVGVPPDLALL